MLSKIVIKKPEAVCGLEDYINKKVLKNIPVVFSLSFPAFVSLMNHRKQCFSLDEMSMQFIPIELLKLKPTRPCLKL